MAAIPEPTSQQYPLDTLHLYRRYTRADLLQLTGENAPAFDLSQPIKRWRLDPADMIGKPPSAMYSYRYVDPADGQYKPYSIPYAQAGKFNLPGAASYAKYVVDPTQATVITFTAQGQIVGNVNANYLSL